MRLRDFLLIAMVAVTLMASSCEKTPTEPVDEEGWVDLFPTPVGDMTSPFSSVDDDTLAIPFTMGFTFTFYGTAYDTIRLNTNGGFTFGAGDGEFHVAAADIVHPGVAVFWGDMDASEYGAESRMHQMRYRQESDRFVIAYSRLQDRGSAAANNTATVTLFVNGTIEIAYGTVLSEDILVGIWDGTHTADTYVSLMATYSGYTSSGTGRILYDDWGPGPTMPTGALDGMTITFTP